MFPRTPDWLARMIRKPTSFLDLLTSATCAGKCGLSYTADKKHMDKHRAHVIDVLASRMTPPQGRADKTEERWR